MSFKQLEKFIFEKMAQTKLPGLSAAVVEGDKVIWSRGFGYRDVERGLPANPQTLYSIGSVSKSFTCLAIMKLAEAGKLKVDDPIDKYMPFDVRPDGKKVRIWHLMSHSSGIADLGTAQSIIGETIGSSENWQPLATTQDMLTYMSDAQEWAFCKPGERWFYLNEGYALLAHIVEKCSGMSFEDYVRQNILEPLGMTRSIYHQADFAKDQDAAVPYINWTEKGRIPSRYSYTAGITGAGGLISNVLDLAKAVSMYLRSGKPILSPASIGEMQTARVDTPFGNPEFGIEGYGYGLMMTPNFYGHQLVGHGGSVGIATAHMAFIPDKNIGVAVLTNGSGYSMGSLARYALAEALGKDPESLPNVRHDRRLKELEGVYAGYKGITKYEVRAAGDFLMVSMKDKLSATNMMLIPESVEGSSRMFYTLMAGNKMYMEFRLDGDKADLLFERSWLKRTGALT